MNCGLTVLTPTASDLHGYPGVQGRESLPRRRGLPNSRRPTALAGDRLHHLKAMPPSLKSYLITTGAVLTALTLFSLPSLPSRLEAQMTACHAAGNPVCLQLNRWMWEWEMNKLRRGGKL